MKPSIKMQVSDFRAFLAAVLVIVFSSFNAQKPIDGSCQFSDTRTIDSSANTHGFKTINRLFDFDFWFSQIS